MKNQPKDEELVWVRIKRRTRNRLNLAKTAWGIVDGGVLDQDAAIAAALDRGNAPTLTAVEPYMTAAQP
jgi:hypothetical protein